MGRYGRQYVREHKGERKEREERGKRGGQMWKRRRGIDIKKTNFLYSKL